jgi:hypothetical protein
MEIHGRKLTPLTERLYLLALEEKMTIPLGRALYATNRHYNGDLYRKGFTSYDADPDDEDYVRSRDIGLMLATKSLTAAQWLSHWVGGGSLRKLS